MSFVKWIMILSNLPILLAALYAIAIYATLGRTLRVFTWYIFITLLIQAPYLVLWLYGINNLALLHIYVLAGFLSLCAFYHSILKGFISPAIILVTAVAFSCFTIINSLFIQPMDTINSYALTAESVLVVILSLFSFIVFLDDGAKESRKDIMSSLRWINSGLFIYYASGLLLFYFSSLMVKIFPTSINRYAWLLNCFFLDVMYICFITGLWKRPKA